MNLPRPGLAALLLAIFGGGLDAAFAAPKTVMAYYMPWYAAKPTSGAWGWHWTMDHFNPESVTPLGERNIASWYYPLIGPYDSADPAALEYHVLLMKLSGIDGVIVDWYGEDTNFDYGENNQRTAALFGVARKAGMKFSVSFEDQTIQHLIDGHFLTTNQAIAHAQEAMLYLQSNYFSDPAFLRWRQKPVLLNFGPQYFKANTDWEEIFSVLAASNQPAFFTEDNGLPIGAGAFDWPPMYLSHTPGTGGVLSAAALENYLGAFDRKAAAWPTFISSAFPRFHDIYQTAGVRDYWGYLGDRNGNTLRETLSRAMTNGSSIVQIVTWNDFGEGTVIEPTREYGYRDLGIIQDLRREYLDSGFAYHTNELGLALRFFNLRKAATGNAKAQGVLDAVFTNIATGNLVEAVSGMSGLESNSIPGASR